MSLLHRTVSTESFSHPSSTPNQASQDLRTETQYFDAPDAPSAAATTGRRLSYNPFGSGAPVAKPVSAYEVSQGRRIAQVAVAVVYCLFAAGVVFGYAALKPVLIAEGVYSEHCDDVRSAEEEERGICYEQELRLNFMFTCAAVSTNVAALPIGTILDRYGPRLASLIGTFFLVLGALFLIFAASVPFDAYLPGYLFLALGGPFVFISSFQLSNTFPRYSGFILALLTGAFDTSSAIFLMYRLVYTGTDGAFKPRHFFLLYLVVPILIIIAQIFLMPKQSYQTAGELLANEPEPTPERGHSSEYDSRSRPGTSSTTEETALLAKNNSYGSNGTPRGDLLAQASHEESTAVTSGVWGALHGQTAWQQIRTPWFVLITLFTVLQMTRINFFVATIRPQYTFLLDSPHLARRVNEVFDVALPAGGVIAIPFIGSILDNTRTVTVLSVLVFVATLIGVLGMIGNAMWVSYAHISLFVLYRPFYYTAVSDYAAKVFGFTTFGKVYGLIICMAGIGNFSQSALDALTWGTFGGNYRPVNGALLALGVLIGVALVVFVGWKGRNNRRRALEEEAEASEGTDREGIMVGGEGR